MASLETGSAKTRILITIDDSLKADATKLFKSQGKSFSGGVSSCLQNAVSDKTEERIVIDAKLARKTAKILDDIGLDLSTATAIYFKEIVRTGSIPFALQTGKPGFEYSVIPTDTLKNE